MTEEYTGIKFRLDLEKKAPQLDARAGELIGWAKKFAEAGLAPDYDYKGKKCSAGNFSYRVRGPVFVITPSAKNSRRLRSRDLVEVVSYGVKEKSVKAVGLRPPSSEVFLHALIYKNRPDAKAVFHGHSREILENAERLGLPVTKKADYGTLELARQAAFALMRSDFVVLKNHGFVALGGSMDEAGNRSLRVLRRARGF